MTELNKNILFQYFSGEASPLQKKLIQEWLQDDTSQELFYKWLEEWEKEHLQFIPDVDMASEKIMNRLDKLSTESNSSAYIFSLKKRPSGIRKTWWVAASVVFLLGLSLYIFHNNFNYIQYQTAYGEVKELTLADGSHVVLNANSSLLVPRWGFNEGDRKVELTGEADFKVKHTKSNQKFMVITNGQLNVEVLGTEFSVYSRNNTNKVELKKGSVKVLFKQEVYKPFIMKPGDVVNVDIAGKLLVLHQQPANNFIIWKDHRFVFDSATLGDAFNYIQEFFGDKIIIGDDRLKERRITGSIKADSTEEALSILKEMYNMEMVEKGDSLILKEKNKTFNK